MSDPWELAIENQGLIKVYLSKNRWIIDKSHTLEYEDYWQIGLIILRDAAEKHDPSKGIFSSYGMKRLKWYMRRAWVNQGFPVMRVSENQHPKKDVDLSAMNFQQAFTYNVLNSRVDLSATNYVKMVDDRTEEEQNSGMFVFFK